MPRPRHSKRKSKAVRSVKVARGRNAEGTDESTTATGDGEAVTQNEESVTEIVEWDDLHSLCCVLTIFYLLALCLISAYLINDVSQLAAQLTGASVDTSAPKSHSHQSAQQPLATELGTANNDYSSTLPRADASKSTQSTRARSHRSEASESGQKTNADRVTPAAIRGFHWQSDAQFLHNDWHSLEATAAVKADSRRVIRHTADSSREALQTYERLFAELERSSVFWAGSYREECSGYLASLYSNAHIRLSGSKSHIPSLSSLQPVKAWFDGDGYEDEKYVDLWHEYVSADGSTADERNSAQSSLFGLDFGKSLPTLSLMRSDLERLKYCTDEKLQRHLSEEWKNAEANDRLSQAQSHEIFTGWQRVVGVINSGLSDALLLDSGDLVVDLDCANEWLLAALLLTSSGSRKAKAVSSTEHSQARGLCLESHWLSARDSEQRLKRELSEELLSRITVASARWNVPETKELLESVKAVTVIVSPFVGERKAVAAYLMTLAPRSTVVSVSRALFNHSVLQPSARVQLEHSHETELLLNGMEAVLYIYTIPAHLNQHTSDKLTIDIKLTANTAIFSHLQNRN